MLAVVGIAVLVALAPAKPSPPTPQTAARVAMQSVPLPHVRAPKPGERTWLPSTYSLSRDPGFTPWSSFFSLGSDRVGEWTLEGTSLGGGLRCGDLRTRWCQPLAEAIVALVWEPDAAPIGLYAGFSLASVAQGGEMKIAPGFTGGLRFRPASLASFVRRVRGYAQALEH